MLCFIDHDIRFGKELLIDMKEQAIRQTKSKNRTVREPGEYALENADEGKVSLYANQFTVEGEAIKNYHIVAWDYITNQQIKIRKKYRQRPMELDIVSIIKKVCPDLIQQCRNIAGLMSSLSEN